MSDNNEHIQGTNFGQHTMSMPVFLIEEGQDLDHRLSTSVNTPRRFSTTSQNFLPYGDEYRRQERVPPSSAEFRQRCFSRTDNGYDGPINERRLSVISEGNHLTEDEENGISSLINLNSLGRKRDRRHRQILFIVEPIIIGLFLLPVLVLFWQCGWNLVWTLLKAINQHSLRQEHHTISDEDLTHYSIRTLLIPYLIVQIFLLLLYLGQDFLYEFLKKRNCFLQLVLLKLHILVLASIYIVQWEMLWTVWDQYTPHEWYFELVLSFTSLFALIVLIGHLSDLVCAPFLVSYDHIEHCIQFGCPLLTRQMNPWKINLINYVLYEVIISNIAIMTWRGFYHFLDECLYPKDADKSAWICLLVGYVLYFPLMYFQNYLEYLNLKFEFWTFVSINFPQLYRNIRHLLAFFSCLFLWRGIWLLYDSHIVIFESPVLTYMLLYLASFLFLALIQTSSSINGPLSNMEDENQFFPLYPNCYVSIIVRKFSRMPCCN
ncbi:unnamed protein product [Rotaria sp. Silwood2]|nr:unnamed protein product [Rotaria sp. Silwood2]CAF2835376.1 unnamed protein product [Rotaria sp. Silwood2]CAF3239699.1 unnamed protein product [Rotaria sp. Silwood2]CAF4215479.1 unnamed protein product [Rotaria sp. Silwood2]CAF4224978.1 unnamed protein product [Rotaria sp. Silwood2]